MLNDHANGLRFATILVGATTKTASTIWILRRDHRDIKDLGGKGKVAG